jgi:integrin beta 3
MAISLAMRAIDEVRTLAARPEPRAVDRMSFDDISIDYDGERSLVFKFVKNNETKELSVHLPIPIYRGVYRDNESYKKGDTTTWGGSIYIAQEDTDKHPRDGNGIYWKLAVKAGRDGRKM